MLLAVAQISSHGHEPNRLILFPNQSTLSDQTYTQTDSDEAEPNKTNFKV